MTLMRAFAPTYQHITTTQIVPTIYQYTSPTSFIIAAANYRIAAAKFSFGLFSAK